MHRGVWQCEEVLLIAQPYQVGVGVAVGAEPQAQEFFVDALRLQARRMPRLIALRQPVPDFGSQLADLMPDPLSLELSFSPPS